MSEDDSVDKLKLRPIISNIGTATYQTAKFLSKILLPLTRSEYTVAKTEDFIKSVRNENVPSDFKIASFVSLFTNVPMEKTINIILRKNIQR